MWLAANSSARNAKQNISSDIPGPHGLSVVPPRRRHAPLKTAGLSRVTTLLPTGCKWLTRLYVSGRDDSARRSLLTRAAWADCGASNPPGGSASGLQHEDLPVVRALHVGLGPPAQHVRAHVCENDSSAIKALTILTERLVIERGRSGWPSRTTVAPPSCTGDTR